MTDGGAGNGRMGGWLNDENVPCLSLRVVKMPSTGLCRITFAGVEGKGNGMILSRCLIGSRFRRHPGKEMESAVA